MILMVYTRSPPPSQLHFAHNGNDIGKSDVGTSAIAASLTGKPT